MKMLPPHSVLVFYLLGFFSGELQGSSFFSSWVQRLPLDMAPTSFDDQYDGCVDSMEGKVGELQRAEFDYAIYAKVWEEAATKWNRIKASVSVPQGFKAEYAIAVLAYTESSSSLYSVFNGAVRKAGQSKDYYLRNFPFKSFHFLLTRALRILRTNSNGRCYTTYRGVKGIRFMTEPSKKVRFGSFTSSSLNMTVATGYGKETLFTIKTCYGADIKENSFYPGEEEVLIPPYEEFLVENSIETADGIRITLNSAGKSSNYNCVYVKGAGLSHLQADVQMPFLFWGFLLVAGAFGAPGFL